MLIRTSGGVSMVARISPQSGKLVSDSIAEANSVVLDALQTVSVIGDHASAALMGLKPEAMRVLAVKMKPHILAHKKACNLALFKPIFDVPQLRMLVTANFHHDSIRSVMKSRLPLEKHEVKPEDMTVKYIRAANAAVLKTWLLCASSQDPLAGILLGVSDAFLAEIALIPTTGLISGFFSMSMPIFVSRFSEGEEWRGICEDGLATPELQREILRTISV